MRKTGRAMNSPRMSLLRTTTLALTSGGGAVRPTNRDAETRGSWIQLNGVNDGQTSDDFGLAMHEGHSRVDDDWIDSGL